MKRDKERRASSLDIRLISRFFLRVVVIAIPPLLLASALLAAPKKPAIPPAKPGKPFVAKPIPPKAPKADAGGAADGGKSDARESVLKLDAAITTKDSGASDPSAVKESERKDGDASVKVFEFGTTEIEGRSRWPALTYFVRRMKAEFEARKLPHRPFLPELEATKGDPAVK